MNADLANPLISIQYYISEIHVRKKKELHKYNMNVKSCFFKRVKIQDLKKSTSLFILMSIAYTHTRCNIKCLQFNKKA